MKHMLISYPLVFLAGAALVWVIKPGPREQRDDPAVVAAGARVASSVVPTDASGVQRGLSEVVDGLSALDRRLQQLEQSVAALASGASRTALGPEVGTTRVEEIFAAVVELKQSIDEQLSRAEARPSRSERLEQLKQEHAETDWTELMQFVNAWQVDRDSSAKELRLLSDEQVIERFGPPTEMWSDEKGVHWVYGADKDPLSGQFQTEIYMRFHDGYVTLVDVALR